MVKRRCDNCAYAGQLLGDISPAAGEGSILICVNRIEAPGRLWAVEASDTCQRFRLKTQPIVRLEPPVPPNDEVRYITLTQGFFAIVDAADYDWLSQFRWHASNPKRPYAHRKERTERSCRTIAMHRLIMDPPEGMYVDHIDGNGLNNRRSNLRICTPHQNSFNQPQRKGTSRFKGVSFRKDCHKWEAQIRLKGKALRLGMYEDEEQAARVYDRKARELYGRFAYLNFPDEGWRQHAPLLPEQLQNRLGHPTKG